MFKFFVKILIILGIVNLIGPTLPSVFGQIDNEDSSEDSYHINYDDSSDEESAQSFYLKYFSFVNSEFQASKLCEIPILKRIQEKDLIFSFLLHEFGIRLLRSEEVEKVYYYLKEKELNGTEVPDDEKLRDCMERAFLKAFRQVYGEREELTIQNQQEKEEVFNQLLENKRALIHAVNKKEMIRMIPYPEGKFSTFNFKKDYIKDVDELCKIVFEVLVDLDIYGKEGFLESLLAIKKKAIKAVEIEKKSQRSPYHSASPLKREIEQKLRSSKFKNIRQFAMGNIEDLSQYPATNPLFENFQNELNLELKRQRILRKTLPINYTSNLHDLQYSPVFILAYIRLLTTSNMRLIKNFQENENILGEDEEKLIRVFNFPGVDGQTIEKHSINKKTGSRTVYAEIAKLKKSTSYPSLSSIIENVKRSYGFTDQDIASWIKLTLQGKGADIFQIPKVSFLSELEKLDLRKFINAITYLLFGLEAARSPASLLVHNMILELIEAGYCNWSWKKAFEDREMPMSIKDAVDISRWQHLRYKTTFKYFYDKKFTKIAIANGNTENAEKIQNLLEKEITVFKDWLGLRTSKPKLNIVFRDNLGLIVRRPELEPTIDVRSTIDVLKFIPLLREACNEWFGISIPSIDWIDDISIDKISDLLEIIDEESEYKFCTEDVIKLVRLLNHHSIRLLELLQYISPKFIIEQIEKHYENWKEILEDFSDENALYLLRSGEYTVEMLLTQWNWEGSSYKFSKFAAAQADWINPVCICTSVVYDNPLLNDPDFYNLISLAKLHFGIKGVNRLIDIGTNPQSYKLFLNYRQELGDEQAIKQVLNPELGYCSYTTQSISATPCPNRASNISLNMNTIPVEGAFLGEPQEAFSEALPWYHDLMSGWWTRQALLFLGIRQLLNPPFSE